MRPISWPTEDAEGSFITVGAGVLAQPDVRDHLEGLDDTSPVAQPALRCAHNGMDPVTLAAGIGGVARLAASIGQALFNLCDSVSLATREFEVFSQEVNTFATVWIVVQPCLTDPSVTLSGPLIRAIARIVNDTRTILVDLRATVALFSDENDRECKVMQRKFLRITTSPEEQRQRRLEKFLKRSKTALQRSQIIQRRES